LCWFWLFTAMTGIFTPAYPVSNRTGSDGEAAYGWGWLVDLLEGLGLESHLVYPTRCKAIASARFKDDKVDARTLAHLLRADLLPQAWIAPQAVRDQRALLRHRVTLVQVATAARNRVHAVLADRGIRVEQRRWTCQPSNLGSDRCRRGMQIATVAVARKLLARYFHILKEVDATTTTGEGRPAGCARESARA
jgi:transposase